MRDVANPRIAVASTNLRMFLVAHATLCLVGCGSVEQSPNNRELLAKAIEGSGPFCLATEFQPLEYQDDELPTLLSRELARQAVLLTARDELGLSTRDETLGESFPEDAAARRGPYDLTVRKYKGGDLSLDLRAPDVLFEHAPLQLIQLDFHCQEDAYQLYTSQAEALEAATRGKLLEQLKSAGFDGKPVKSDPTGAMPDGIESLLQKMEVTSQYAAVRKLHGAIAEKGESPARLGGLVRGYANLAALTRHYWNSANVAFTARSLLYAERMMATSGESQLAYQHRAYARALAGLHAAALADLAHKSDGDAQSSAAAAQPPWIAILEPYCKFQRDELITAGEPPEVGQLANLLAFELTECYANERWNIAAGAKALQACPEAYCIYSELANHTPMQVQRQSVSTVAEAIGRRIPINVAHMEGLPDPVFNLVKDVLRPDASWLVRIVTGKSESKAGSPLPRQIADGLRRSCKEIGDSGEPSWDVLASLISDEQFVAVADYLMVSTNAVEYSKEELVERFEPLVKDHPYAPYIESYKLGRDRPPVEFAQYAAAIKGCDPRPCMQQLPLRFWNHVDANNQTFACLYNHAIWTADRTFPAMVASLNLISESWWQKPETVAEMRPWVADFQAVAPNAPNSLRLEILTTDKPSDEQLAKWEERAGGDPVALTKIGNWYYSRKNLVAAIRCYDRSYSLSPEYKTATYLAVSYRDAGKEDKWLPALESYLKEDDYALGHALIHQTIANDYMRKGKWSDAEPHALEAAQTWSAWGLILASRVEEGLGKWDESERWIREAVESYPTYSGNEWYYWCVRNGRGDLAAARKPHDEFLQLDWVQNLHQSDNYVFVDMVLAGQFQRGLDEIQSQPQYAEDDYWQNFALLLAKRLGNEALYIELTDKLVKRINEVYGKSDPDLCALYALVERLAHDGSLSADDIAAADKLFERYGPISRTNYCYFFGEQLALHGDMENAERYWQLSLNAGQFQKYTATLAGQRLAALHGTSRTSPLSEPPADSEVEAIESGKEIETAAERSL